MLKCFKKKIATNKVPPHSAITNYKITNFEEHAPESFKLKFMSEEAIQPSPDDAGGGFSSLKQTNIG